MPVSQVKAEVVEPPIPEPTKAKAEVKAKVLEPKAPKTKSKPKVPETKAKPKVPETKAKAASVKQKREQKTKAARDDTKTRAESGLKNIAGLVDYSLFGFTAHMMGRMAEYIYPPISYPLQDEKTKIVYKVFVCCQIGTLSHCIVCLSGVYTCSD